MTERGEERQEKTWQIDEQKKMRKDEEDEREKREGKKSRRRGRIMNRSRLRRTRRKSK